MVKGIRRRNRKLAKKRRLKIKILLLGLKEYL